MNKEQLLAIKLKDRELQLKVLLFAVESEVQWLEMGGDLHTSLKSLKETCKMIAEKMGLKENL